MLSSARAARGEQWVAGRVSCRCSKQQRPTRYRDAVGVEPAGGGDRVLVGDPQQAETVNARRTLRDAAIAA